MAWGKRAGQPKYWSGLHKLILAHLRERPNVKLSSIEKAVKAPRVEVAAAIRDLTQRGKVCKDEETGEYHLFL